MASMFGKIDRTNIFEIVRGFGNRGGRSARPTTTVGTPGTAIYGGYIVDNERNPKLQGPERYRTFSEILANTSVVAAGVRYFLNLAANAKWTFEPSELDVDGKYAEMTEQILTEDPASSWARIVRRAAMYRFYGFSVQEWTAMKRKDDGVMTFRDIAPRAQLTIERWDVDREGRVVGVVQRSPQDNDELYIPRTKLLYMCDDTLSDSPEGLGLFRHLVEPARRLERYEQLEGFGYETDLNGVPVGRAPYAELMQKVERGQMSLEKALALTSPVESFVRNHIKTPTIGLFLDSMTYQTTDESQTPSNVPKFDVDLLRSGSAMQPDIARAIERLNKEMARILGVESIILGDGQSGSNALSRDKTDQFSLQVDSTISEVVDTVKNDLIKVIFTLNGWPLEMMPKPKVEAVSHQDISEIATTLRDMASAGAVLAPDDPAINAVRALMGLPDTDKDERELAAALNSGDPQTPSTSRAARSPADDPNAGLDTPVPPGEIGARGLVPKTQGRDGPIDRGGR